MFDSLISKALPSTSSILHWYLIYSVMSNLSSSAWRKRTDMVDLWRYYGNPSDPRPRISPAGMTYAISSSRPAATYSDARYDGASEAYHRASTTPQTLDRSPYQGERSTLRENPHDSQRDDYRHSREQQQESSHPHRVITATGHGRSGRQSNEPVGRQTRERPEHQTPVTSFLSQPSFERSDPSHSRLTRNVRTATQAPTRIASRARVRTQRQTNTSGEWTVTDQIEKLRSVLGEIVREVETPSSGSTNRVKHKAAEGKQLVDELENRVQAASTNGRSDGQLPPYSP